VHRNRFKTNVQAEFAHFVGYVMRGGICLWRALRTRSYAVSEVLELLVSEVVGQGGVA
jgi:hypothetical protein